MGNNYSQENGAFYMHIKFIGLNMGTFYSKFINSLTLHNIIKLWKIDPLENIDLSKQINNYFEGIQNKKNDEDNKDINLRECLIIKVNNTYEPEVNCIVKKINELESYQYMPLVLILTTEKSYNKNFIDTEKYENVDPRLFFVEKYTENPIIIEDKIVPKILRFCSIHNELGDVFSLDKDKKNEQKFDLIESAFPFNLNIACIGRFGQGKSTGVNQILGEYKAKESNKGCSQTKNITFYQVNNKPIRILDVPGFESTKTIQDAVEKFKKYRVKLNKLRDNIHIILYFLNYTETRAFMELEYPILEEITKHKSAQIIYVITHSKSIKPKNRNKIYDRINSGIQGVTRNKSLYNKIEKFKATEKNVVFVNFHYDDALEVEPFGKKELFKTIYNFFIESKDYKDSLLNLSSEERIEETALKLRAQAQSVLLPNKIWGGAVGIIPFADWALQRFVINENAVKKVGQIFGIDAKFIDEDNEKEKEMLNNEEDKIYYTTPGLTDDSSNSYIIGDKLTKQETEYKVGKTAECFAHAGEYSGAISAVSIGVNAATKAGQLTASAANLSTKAAQITNNMNNAGKLTKLWNFISGAGSAMAKEAAELSSQAASAEAAAAESAAVGTLGKAFGVVFAGVGIVFGVGLGAYFTHKFCEETLDKFVEYYKKNAGKIRNSYQEAAEYFLN